MERDLVAPLGTRQLKPRSDACIARIAERNFGSPVTKRLAAVVPTVTNLTVSLDALALIVAPAARTPRERLAADLWPQSTSTAGGRTFASPCMACVPHSTSLALATPSTQHPAKIAFAYDRWSIDIAQFESAARAALRERSLDARSTRVRSARSARRWRLSSRRPLRTVAR